MEPEKQITPFFNAIFHEEWNENMSLEELHHHLTLHVQSMMKNRFSELMQLAYKVDVREKDFANALTNDSEMESASNIAHLLIHRVLEKKAHRENYAKDNPYPPQT